MLLNFKAYREDLAEEKLKNAEMAKDLAEARKRIVELSAANDKLVDKLTETKVHFESKVEKLEAEVQLLKDENLAHKTQAEECARASGKPSKTQKEERKAPHGSMAARLQQHQHRPPNPKQADDDAAPQSSDATVAAMSATATATVARDKPASGPNTGHASPPADEWTTVGADRKAERPKANTKAPKRTNVDNDATSHWSPSPLPPRGSYDNPFPAVAELSYGRHMVYALRLNQSRVPLQVDPRTVQRIKGFRGAKQVSFVSAHGESGVLYEKGLSVEGTRKIFYYEVKSPKSHFWISTTRPIFGWLAGLTPGRHDAAPSAIGVVAGAARYERAPHAARGTAQSTAQ